MLKAPSPADSFLAGGVRTRTAARRPTPSRRVALARLGKGGVADRQRRTSASPDDCMGPGIVAYCGFEGLTFRLKKLTF